MSTKMSRAWVPLLAAPVALVCLAGTAAAVIDVDPYIAASDTNETAASCDHPNEAAYFEVFITTGDEETNQRLDLTRLSAEMADADAPNSDFRVTDAHAVEFTYTYGIYDENGDFSPTAGPFKAGSKLKHGAFTTSKKKADVEAVKFEGKWRFLHPDRMRTVSCVVPLDGYTPPE